MKLTTHTRKGIAVAALAATTLTLIPVAAAQDREATISNGTTATLSGTPAPTTSAQAPTSTSTPAPSSSATSAPATTSTPATSTAPTPAVEVPAAAGYDTKVVSPEEIKTNRVVEIAPNGDLKKVADSLTFAVVESSVPKGFKAEVAKDGVVKVTLPDTADVGNYTLKVTYSQEGKDTVEKTLTLSIKDTIANEVGKISYETDTLNVPAGNSRSIKLAEGVKIPGSANFTIESATAGWGTTIGANGTVVVNAPAGEAQEGSVRVRVRFEDGSDSFIEFKVKSSIRRADIFTPTYGNELTIKRGPEFAKDFPITFEGEGIPNVTASIPENHETSGDFDVNFGFDQNSGSFTGLYFSKNAPADAEFSIPVTFTYADGTQDTETFRVKVVNDDAAVYVPAYSDELATLRGESKTVVQSGVTSLPEGSMFTIDTGDETAAAWNLSVDSKTGDLSFTAPQTAEVGSVVTFPVTLSFADGSKNTTNVKIKVATTQAESTTPFYEDARVKPGESVTINNTGEKFPEGAKVSAVEDTIKDGWKVDVTDAQALVVTPPADAEVDDSLTFKIRVDYVDGSNDGQELTVTVSVYTPDVIKRVIKRVITIEVPPTQEEIDAAVRERDAKLREKEADLLKEGFIIENSGRVRQATLTEKVGAEVQMSAGAVRDVVADPSRQSIAHAGRTLANTGASVIGLGIGAVVIALAGIAFAAFRRRDNK